MPSHVISTLYSASGGARCAYHVVHGPTRQLRLSEIDIGSAEWSTRRSRTTDRCIDRPRIEHAIHEVGRSRSVDWSESRRNLLHNGLAQHCSCTVHLVAVVCGDGADNQGQHADGANYQNCGRHESLDHGYSGIRPAALPVFAMVIHISILFGS